MSASNIKPSAPGRKPYVTKLKRNHASGLGAGCKPGRSVDGGSALYMLASHKTTDDDPWACEYRGHR